MRDIDSKDLPKQDQDQVLRYLEEVDNTRAAKVLYDYLLLEGYDVFKQNQGFEYPD